MTANRRIRVLVVDDSALVRKAISDSLARDPEIEVVGTAVDPIIAREKIAKLNPDVLTLDIEMPRMDGLTFLRLLMQEQPIPVIILSSLSTTASQAALDALQAGAVDVLAKPGSSFSIGELSEVLPARIKAAAQVRLATRAGKGVASRTDTRIAVRAETRVPEMPASRQREAAPLPPSSPPTQEAAEAPARRQSFLGRFLSAFRDDGDGREPEVRSVTSPRASPVAAESPSARRVGVEGLSASGGWHARQLIALGASTGGTEALRDVLTQLPGNLPPIAIVQHIPPYFSKAFADRLNTLCAFEVHEAVDGERLKDGMAVVAPGGWHLLLQWSGSFYTVRLKQGPPVWHQRPAVDVLFNSIPDPSVPYTVSGLLTGMGRDGAEGLLRLRQKGARTFAQSEETCVVFGMPRVAMELGAAEQMVPLPDCARAIVAGCEQMKRAAPSMSV
jgi:two-component system chemotaxis response regulator CheB